MNLRIFLFFFILFLNIYSSAEIKIGITQFLSHPTLEKVRSGIIQGLKEKGLVEGKNLSISYKNANGNISLASQVAKQFSSQQLNLVIAITTPSAQTVKKALKGSIPLVFATVTDPLEAGLVKNLDNPRNNITGTSNPIIFKQQLEYLKLIMPRLKKLGVIINYSEDNSVTLLKKLEEIAPRLGIELVISSVTNTSDVPMVMKKLITKIEGLFLLQDNTVASSLNLVLKTAMQNNIPVFSTYIEAVERGALAGLAYDEFAIGKQTGKLAAKVIHNKSAVGLAVEKPQLQERVINLKTAKRLGIKIKESVLYSSSIINN